MIPRTGGDFGTTGTRSWFRGPYAGGPPAEDLEVDVPPIGSFGVRELARMVTVYLTLTLSLARAMAGWVLRRRGRSAFAAASEGAINGFLLLGPTYVKLGQIIASSPGLFPEPLAKAAERCLDEVPPFDGATAREMIRADLGQAPNAIFKSFDESPLSAASIGQVHACVLPDGREAVIKLQRPNIRRRMTTDLRIAFRLAKTLEHFFSFARNAAVVALIEDLHAVTYQELNPALEAWRQDRFREKLWAFGDNKFITTPEIYWDYCGPHMICMERMTGIPMDEFDAIREKGLDGELIIRRGAKTWLEAVVVHGPFHGDMHAGNLWVLDDGRASYLDFGIMGEVPDEFKSLIRDLFYTFVFDQKFARIARAYKNLGIMNDEMGTDEEVGMRIQMVVAPMLGKSSSLSLGDFIMSSLDMMKQFGLTAPKEMVLFSKQMLYMERYIKGLAPDWQFGGDPYLLKNIFPAEAAAKAAEVGMVFPE
ncbi:MAG TPA: AarF/UbiB family protein [Acidimicrobiales bacterium]|jgi:predicted unusual protein kinase regulating ubiquinone biosynthesis (AarF/ABC1/UbiB family)|nr:AarF/UbiB family protein [Acidimicrobiales bacterium]